MTKISCRSRQRLVDCVVDDLPQAVHQPLVSVEPMYIAGRFRTASRPSGPADAAPRTRGFPLLGWQLARAESTSWQALNGCLRAIRTSCRTESFDGSTPRVSITGFVPQQSLPRDEETEQSEADEMLNDASPCITAQPSEQRDHLIVRRSPL